ncbi:hypothetical protein TrRE_jg12491, partial [Triparma retinervis]
MAGDGSVLYCGKGLASESSPEPSSFAVKLSSTGTLLWSWVETEGGGGSACNAVLEIPGAGTSGGSQVAVVGWRTVSGVGRRTVTILDMDNGLTVQTYDGFGDAAGSHGALEMGELTSDGLNLVLSGLKGKENLDEMSFKSYGNVSGGTAVVHKISLANLRSGGASSWSREFGGYFSAKCARQVGTTDSLMVQLYGEAEEKHASVAKISLADGSTTWGPNDYSEHGEGTDLQVSKDGSAFFITGQGVPATNEIEGRLTKAAVSDGARAWTKAYSVGGNPRLIFNECWGGAVLSDGSGIVVSCGAGIEGDQCGNVSGQDRADCLAGDGDKRAGAYKRKAD